MCFCDFPLKTVYPQYVNVYIELKMIRVISLPPSVR